MLASYFFVVVVLADKSRTPVSIRQQLATIVIMVTPPIIIIIIIIIIVAIDFSFSSPLSSSRASTVRHTNTFRSDQKTFPLFSPFLLIKLHKHTKKADWAEIQSDSVSTVLLSRFFFSYIRHRLLTQVCLPSVIHQSICLMPSSMSLSFRFTCRSELK